MVDRLGRFKHYIRHFNFQSSTHMYFQSFLVFVDKLFLATKEADGLFSLCATLFYSYNASVNSEVNARRVANVEQCFGKMARPLSLFGRVLVGEGVLVKMCRKKPKRRMKNGWIVKTPEKSFAVYAASPKEKKEWMIHIERCVADLLEKGCIVMDMCAFEFFFIIASTGNKRPAKEHAAVWIPDGEAARCMACGRTQFNLVQRRHHCRACGRVICGSCSTHSYRIDNLNKKPVRVCDMVIVSSVLKLIKTEKHL
ncbi:unnamed protein product [Angiostrongylus costaricensis]|uniref:FYVE-type domain-containing protein n=1 Tax=Angiostrongylus costaricensis TaxID=334426 RepID=A0A0R3Q1R5_ANGCS|nr:unnamed protein product [Angiostrongylus costaricensis]